MFSCDFSSSGIAGFGGGRGLFVASGQAWCFTGERPQAARKAARLQYSLYSLGLILTRVLGVPGLKYIKIQADGFVASC